ncbi:Vascular endothelial growth factor receptor 1 [Camponotus floridanus]|uniref:receptor protein-tyrosine kinase n=1 Tax=Camponotus floridanus TaxID=104421 RepID=E2AY54_CAMFO|nr:Vascular endothelial growth factor receptor 1 [Camponotus floridanus]
MQKFSESNKPIISPNQEEIVLNEGEFLEIICTGTAPLKFVYPDTFDKEVFNTSTPRISKNEENGVYKYIFQRPKIIFGDTGWYGCADYNVEIPNFFDNSEVNWLYVYVKSNTNLFVEADTYAHLNAVAGDSIVIPCRPTSPDLDPDLSNNNEDELEGKASFDPRIGFTIKNLTVKDSDWYKCSIQKDNEEHQVNYVLAVHLRQTLPDPKIHDDTLRHVTRGQDLFVNCTVEIDASVRYVFNWSTPQSNSRVSTQQFRKQLDDNYLLVTCQLTVFNVTDEDAGEYKCIIRSIHDTKDTKKNITIHDGIGAFGIIGPKELVTKDDTVELICAASVYNYTDDLTWTKLENETETPVIETNPVSPFFTKTNMNETIVKNIDVIAEGHKTVILQCFADGMPKPIIAWYKDNVLLVENDQYLFKFNYQELNIKYFKEYDSGRYSCRAINRLGTNETYQEIMVKNAKLQKLDVILAVSIAILGITLVILAIFFTIKVRREKKMRKELMEAGLMHFEEGALECLNPDLTVDDQAELLPYDKKWEFPREQLKLGKQLGSGAFGVVMKAEAQGISENETVTTVAVKMVRRTTDPTYVRALASELKIMVHLGKHLNVVNLLGACTKNISKRELLVIVEYCRFGNLHNYLLKHRSNFINQIDPNTGKLDLTIGVDILTRTASISSNNSISANSGTDTVVHYCPGTSSDTQEINFSPDGCVLSNNSFQPDWRTNYRGDYKDQNLKPICTQDLLSYAFQVARGMEYLSQRRVLHGDLAARNILLCENNIVKICDFGLAKTMYKDDNYKKKGDGPLPIKWMAIESIRDRIFSTQSDIWSFGIVLWEFFTLSETPYPSMEAEKLYQKLIEGYRMEQPEYSIREIYEIMSQCWKAKPTLRPSFTDLVESIGNLLEESVKSHYISLNTPYMDMNTMILESGKNDYLTMMSAPDHGALSSPGHYANSPFSEGAPDSSYLCMSPNCQTNESGIFSPRPHEDRSHFEFPSPASDSEDAVELSPMLKHEEDPYLKPINVQERRAEFARQREAMKNQMTERSIDRDSGYCNAPRNLHLIDLNDMDENDAAHRADADSKKDYVPPIISTQDNYVNMPKQKSDLRLGVPDGFSNPSYVMMNTREMDQRV